MTNLTETLSTKNKLLTLVGCIFSVSMTFFLIRLLPQDQAVLMIALILAILIVTAANVSNSILRTMAIASIAGILIGFIEIFDLKEGLIPDVRFTLVAFQSMAGFTAGVLLGRKAQQAHLPTLKEVLSTLSGLTVGIFAVVVTYHFIIDGLEYARSLSSRLSVSTTVLLTLTAIPAAIGYLLAEQFRKNRKQNQEHEI
jgi:hypothetical protein